MVDPLFTFWRGQLDMLGYRGGCRCVLMRGCRFWKGLGEEMLSLLGMMNVTDKI